MAFYRLKRWWRELCNDFRDFFAVFSYRKRRIQRLESAVEQFLGVWSEVSKYHFTDRELVEAIKNLSRVYHGG